MRRSIFDQCLSILVLIGVLALAGCRKEDPNPELLDPIFKDLDKRASDFQKKYDDELKKEGDLRNDIDRAEPNTLDLRNARADLDKSKKLLAGFDQMAHYYRIRAKRRLLVDRITYKAAFAKGEVWPDPQEYSDYQVNNRLEEAPRNWNARVPKLNDRLSNSRQKVAKTSGEAGE